MIENISDIEEVVGMILFRYMELSNRVSSLEAENASLTAEKSSLETENAKLRAQLSRLENPQKDSHNSSIPPSAESLKAQAVRRTRSLRMPSGRPTGGQTGHKGSTLQMSDTPDVVKKHIPAYCTRCGLALTDMPEKVSEVRQSIDIPLPVCPIVTNHESIEKTCSCGHCNRGSFPVTVKSGVSYGANLHAVVAYLSVVQHIPFKRLVAVIKDFYGMEISQGTVSNILNRMRKQSFPAYSAIRQSIEKSSVTGADETGEKLNGELHWMWVFQNDLLTYIFQHPSRGKAAIDSHFPNGLPRSILVTDRHRSYFNMETAGHQICLAHLLRELIYLSELNKEQTWSSDMLELLRDSIHQRKTIPFAELDAGSIKDRFDILLKRDLGSLDKKFESLRKSLEKHKEYMFKFLERADVPYDNNATESKIRPLKVKQKVSGMFKSDNGGNTFTQLYSIVDTARKHNRDPLIALIAVAENVSIEDTS
jgi:transposase/regulator of replication initiation timing